MPTFKQFMILDRVSKSKSPVFRLAALKSMKDAQAGIALLTFDGKVFYTSLNEKFILTQEVSNG